MTLNISRFKLRKCLNDRCNSGFGPPADLVPLGPYPLADLVPLNEILADLAPTKTLNNLSFFRKILCKHLINIFAKLVLSKLVFLDGKLMISGPVRDYFESKESE